MKECSKCGSEKDGKHVSYCKSCYREYKREWYQKNRQKEIERCKKYNKENPEVARDSMRRLRNRESDRMRKYTRDYRKNNPDKATAWDNNKRAKRRHQISISIGVTPDQWTGIKERYSNCCAYCGRKSDRLQMDHIVPLSKGGLHEPGNICPACQFCNGSKNARDEIEFRQSKGQLL